MKKTYYIGLDVGSTTAKIAVIDSDNRVIYSKYERHNARVNELVSQYFDEILALVGDAEARICVTGSVGMATAEQPRRSLYRRWWLHQSMPVLPILRRRRSSILVARMRRLSSSRKTEIWNCA